MLLNFLWQESIPNMINISYLFIIVGSSGIFLQLGFFLIDIMQKFINFLLFLPLPFHWIGRHSLKILGIRLVLSGFCGKVIKVNDDQTISEYMVTNINSSLDF